MLIDKGNLWRSNHVTNFLEETYNDFKKTPEETCV
jgi:hypothetical protein